jgi:hypothetical protein
MLLHVSNGLASACCDLARLAAAMDHLYLGLPISKRAIKDVFNQDTGIVQLREVSGETGTM